MNVWPKQTSLNQVVVNALQVVSVASSGLTKNKMKEILFECHWVPRQGGVPSSLFLAATRKLSASGVGVHFPGPRSRAT